MKATLYTKIDKETKDQAQNLASELGVPLSMVINSQLREFVRSGNFSVSRDPDFKEGVWKEILQASKEAQNPKKVSPKFDNAEDALNWLNS